MRKGLYYFIIILITTSIIGCKSTPPGDKLSELCEINFNSENYKKELKKILEEPSDSSSICFEELSNIDTLKFLYKNKEYNSTWYTDENSATIVDSILFYFKTADLHGLNPNWYHYYIIQNHLEEIKKVKYDCDSIYKLLAETEILLSNSLIDYCNHINYGFINPMNIYEKSFSIPLKQRDSLLIEKVFTPSGILEYLTEIQPKDDTYLKLQKELELIKLLSWDSIPLPDTPKIGLHDTSIVLPYIARRLKVTGEISNDYNPDSIIDYDTILKKAIVHFQLYNGLLSDGIIGYNTINQLNVSVKDRAIQIAANLERLRWSDQKYTGKHFFINIPEFTLYAYNCDTFKFALRVCVGEKKPKNYDERMKKYLKTHKILDRPPNHETPVFNSKISHIVLNPDWLVPINIVQKELYFNFIKDPFYLKDHDYKVYLDNVEVNPDSIKWRKYSPDHIPFRIKQNPGEINALGKIKFVFYNPYDVFLHDTPSKNHFNRSGRAVSHGCIRVEEPLKLVKFLLEDEKKFDVDEIRMAIGMEPEKLDPKDRYNRKKKEVFKEKMEKYKELKEQLEMDSLTLETKKIFLRKPSSIVVNYSTAFIDTNGILQFREDLYKRDLPIMNKLKEQSLNIKKVRN